MDGCAEHGAFLIVLASRTSGSSEDLEGVTFGNKTFIAVGDSGTVLTSSDNGTSWTSRTSGTNNDLYGIVYKE